MKPRKKLLSALAFSIAATLLLTSCATDSSNSSGSQVKMTLWHNAGTGPGQAFWKKTIADFETKNPNVSITLQILQNEDLDGKLQTALNSSDAPDIFLQRGGGKMTAMVKAGQLMDLTNLLSDQAKTNIPEASFVPGTYQNKIWSIPIAALPGGFFYSKDLFAAAGIQETPATIDDLTTTVDALRASGVAPIALGAKDAWPAAHWYYFFALRQCSVKTLQDTADTLSFTDECWLKAAEHLAAFAKTNPFNDGFLTTSAQQGAGSSAGLLANHKAAMELMGAWNPGVIASLTPDEQPLPDLSWFPFPEVTGGKGEPGAIMGGIDGFSCSAKAPKECADFLNYIAEPSVQVEYYQAFNAPPVNLEAQKSVTEPYLQKIIAAYTSAPFISQWLDTIYGLNVGNALNISVVDMLAGKGSPKQLVQAVNDAAKKA